MKMSELATKLLTAVEENEDLEVITLNCANGVSSEVSSASVLLTLSPDFESNDRFFVLFVER
jgi:hypothetical protein